MSSPSADHGRTVGLGSAVAGLFHPPALSPWFADLPELSPETGRPARWVSIRAEPGRTTFSFAASTGAETAGLELGDALALVWETLASLLVVDLADGFALHGAALRNHDGLLLLPGQSGAGKSRLSLWCRARGFSLGTDELVSLAFEPGGDAAAISAACLPRPVILKGVATAEGLVEAIDGHPALEALSASGLIVKPGAGDGWTGGMARRVLVVFPHFLEGAPLQLSALTPGQTAFRLVGNCINVRNLPKGGLALAGRLGQAVMAVTLTYGDTAQLSGTLDVLARQALAGAPGRADLAALCEAFTAKAGPREGIGPGVTPQPAAGAKRVVPAATLARYPRRLTVGMTTFDDYDGVYFSLQAIRTFHPELAGELEFLVIDNNPGGRCSQALKQLCEAVDGCRYLPRGEWSGTAMRNAVFEEASSDSVLCMDSHVFIVPGALARLVHVLESGAGGRDLLQGPLLLDDLHGLHTHMEPQWRGGMFGIWGSDRRGDDPEAPAFDIPMQGLGLFACRRKAWVGFNEAFRGFGAEEGYIHEKTRQNGGRTLCLPFLRWVHRFNRPFGVPYVNRWEDRIRNYLLGWRELGLGTAEMEAHFDDLLGIEASRRIFAETRRTMDRP